MVLQGNNKCAKYITTLRKELENAVAVFCLNELNESEKIEILKEYAGIETNKLPMFQPKEVIRQGGYDVIKEVMDTYLKLKLVKNGNSFDIIAPWSPLPMASFNDLDEVLDRAYGDMIEFGIWRIIGHSASISENILQENFRSLDDIFYYLEEFWFNAGIRFYLCDNEMPALRISKTCPRV